MGREVHAYPRVTDRRRALDVQLGAEITHEVTHDREPQTRALAHLGREEGLEHSASVGRIDARTAVVNLEYETAVPRLLTQTHAHLRLIECEVQTLAPPSLDGVAGIAHQVHDDLMDVVGARADRLQADIELQLDARAQLPTRTLDEVDAGADELGDIDLTAWCSLGSQRREDLFD